MIKFTFFIPEDVLSELRKEAEKRRVGLSILIRLILVNWLKGSRTLDHNNKR